MSKRFLRWIDNWIEDNVPLGSGGDVEPYAARAVRLRKRLLADAATEGFRPEEIAEETEKVAGLIEKKLAAKPEFDLSTFGAPGDD